MKLSPIVISSRVRLARNLEEFPFTSKLDHDASKAIVEKLREALGRLGTPINETSMNDTAVKKQLLVEDHIISPDFCKENALELDTAIAEDFSSLKGFAAKCRETLFILYLI